MRTMRRRVRGWELRLVEDDSSDQFIRAAHPTLRARTFNRITTILQRMDIYNFLLI